MSIQTVHAGTKLHITATAPSQSAVYVDDAIFITTHQVMI